METSELQIQPGVSRLSVDELHLLRGLLAFPGEPVRELVQDLATVWDWLAGAERQLASLGLDEWRAEYRRLFFRGQQPAQCPPFATDYAGPGEGPAWAMASLHLRAGFPLTNMPPDYICAELNLLAELLESEQDLGPALLGEAWEHLRGWVPEFATRLERQAQVELYRGVARRLLELFV